MSGTVRKLAVVASGINEEYQSSVLEGIRQYAATHPVKVCHFVDLGGVIGSDAHDHGEFNIYHYINLKDFEGIIMLANTIQSKEAQQKLFAAVRAAGIPAVVLDTEAEGMTALRIDNYKAMRSIVEHIVQKHGCRRINYIGGPETNPEGIERRRAVLDVLAEYGIHPEPRRIYDGHFMSEDGTAAARQFLADAADRNPDTHLDFPEAIICANDNMAIAAMNTLCEAGINAPEDVLVTGFDYTYAGRNYSPELSSVERPLVASGYRACEMILNGEITPNETHVTVLDTEAHFIHSCGCAGETSSDNIRAFKKVCFRQMEQSVNDSRLNNRMNCAFAECDTPQQMMTQLRPFVLEMNCDDFYLCLNSDWAGDTEAILAVAEGSTEQEQYRVDGYPETMNILLGCENGEFFEDREFPSSEMLPALNEEPDQGKCYYFFPLHFRDRAFGTCVLCGGESAMYSPSIFSWMITIGNALEHVRKIRATNAVVNRLERLYVLDPLSGIFNRNGFAKETRSPYEFAARHHLPVIVMFADLDGLKQINDHFGHQAGDTAIRAVGQAIQNVCRHDEVYARFGGDEFLIFAADRTETDGDKLVQMLQAEFRRFNETGEHPFTLSASIGFYVAVPQPNTSVFHMVSVADQKMYEEKKKLRTSRYLRKY